MSSISERYIGTHVLVATGVVCLLLAGFYLFVLFVGEYKSIDQGDFGLFSALFFILLQLPYQLYLFFPIACLLGSLFGLGVLANNHELLAFRAAGLSKFRIMVSVFGVIGVLSIAVCMLGEVFFPKLSAWSKEWKTSLMSGSQTIKTNQGVWLTQDDNFIHIDTVFSQAKLQGISQFKFAKDNQLTLLRYIERAELKGNKWVLTNVEETAFSNLEAKPSSSKVKSTHYAHQEWDLVLSPPLLLGTSQDPEDMDLFQLRAFISAQKKAHIDASYYEITYWRRLSLPLTTLVMVLIAMPSVFGSFRSVTMGQRLMMGIFIGFTYHLLNKLALPVSQLYQISPFLTATVPTLLFGGVGLLLFWRVR